MSYREAIQRGLSGKPGALIGVIFWSVIDAWALTVLVFLRRRFGERLYTPFHFIFGNMLLAGVVFTGALDQGIVSAMRQASTSSFNFIAAMYAAAFFVVGGFRLLGIYQRSWNDDFGVFSRSMGEPYLLKLGANYWMTTIILEPALILLIGAALTAMAGARMSGLYFVVVAFMAFATAMHAYRMQRDDLLDANDARLMAQSQQALLAILESGGKPTPNAGGVFLPSLLPGKREDSLAILRQIVESNRPPAPASLPSSELPSAAPRIAAPQPPAEAE